MLFITTRSLHSCSLLLIALSLSLDRASPSCSSVRPPTPRPSPTRSPLTLVRCEATDKTQSASESKSEPVFALAKSRSQHQFNFYWLSEFCHVMEKKNLIGVIEDLRSVFRSIFQAGFSECVCAVFFGFSFSFLFYLCSLPTYSTRFVDSSALSISR